MRTDCDEGGGILGVVHDRLDSSPLQVQPIFGMLLWSYLGFRV